MFRPPWPWPLRRFGEPPEDWEGDGYSQYYGLEFPTEIDIPCEDVCNFMAGSTWKLEGSFSGEVETYSIFDPTPLPFPFTLDDSVSELEAPLGQSVSYSLEADGSTIEETYPLGSAWYDLDSIYELSAPPIFYPPDIMVGISAFHLVTGTSANPLPDDERSFDIGYSAEAYFPELCKNEDGDIVWRIKIVGSVSVSDPAFPGTSIGTARSIGLEFVDLDYPEYSKIIEPASPGFTLKLTVNRN